MTSHTYEFGVKDLAKLFLPPLLVVAFFAGLMQMGAKFGLWPRPRPTLDVDRTILIHQAETSQTRQQAVGLLVGDSSCLMDVSALRLGELVGQDVLNLGTFSFLDLRAYATMVRQYTRANPEQLRWLVLLMHPEALRRREADPRYVDLLADYYDGRDSCPGARPHHRLRCALGLEIFRGRLLARTVPPPLRGAFGRRYGFTRDLERYLTRSKGSAVDPESQAFQGNAEYQLAPELETASREFRAALPAGVKLFVAITPVPEGFALPDYPSQRDDMLKTWSQWLGADAALAELPARWPGRFFSQTTHLNESGAAAYTDLLAQALTARGLSSPQPPAIR